MDNNEKIDSLKDQIWTTRVSRINAEKRLQQKEAFIQALNIYYSCITIIFSIMSYINKDDKLSVITIYMTVSLLVAIMYLNSQKYGEKAQLYRENYTALHELEFKLDNLTNFDETEKFNKTVEIETEYCKLLNYYNNHITFDYYCTLKGSNPLFQEKKSWNKVKGKYYWGIFWRTVIKVLMIILPFVLFIFRGVL